MFDELQFMIKNNMNIIISILILMIGAYLVGRNSIDVSRATICKNDIISLNQCLDDQSKNQKYYLDEIARVKSECQLDNSVDICKNEIESAIENYKALNQLFCD
jgi:hypothetical protein